MAPFPNIHDGGGGAATGTRVGQLLDRALVALATGDRRAILTLVRDHPDALAAMGGRFGMSHKALSQDLSMFHALEFEDQLEALPGRYDPAFLGAARLGADSAVLDVGCGSGASARAAARAAPQGMVLGVDLSAAMVKRSAERTRGERVANVKFEKGDVEVHPFEEGSFDVAISRFGAMYFAHPVAAFANIGRALRPAGRLALVAWRDVARNEWMTAVRDALAQGRTLPERAAESAGAFGLAAEAHVRHVLGDAGFVDIGLDEVSEPVIFGPDLQSAYALVSTQGLARDLLDGLDSLARRRALDELRAVLAAHETPEGILFGSTCWIITARRP